MAGENHFLLYADNDIIAGQNPMQVQTTLAAMVRILDRVGLITNIGKTKAMVCTPGFIWVQQGISDHNRKQERGHI